MGQYNLHFNTNTLKCYFLEYFLVAVARGGCRKAGIFVVLGSKHQFSGHPSSHAYFFRLWQAGGNLANKMGLQTFLKCKDKCVGNPGFLSLQPSFHDNVTICL